MSDAAIVVIAADGTITYRASALGGCDMALLAARLEYEPVRGTPEGIAKVFAAGHRIEDEVLATLPHVKFRQAEVKVDVTSRLKIVGHIDGIDIRSGELVEIKSQNREEWDRFGRDGWDSGLFPKYKWQVSAYMWALNKRLTLIRALRDENGEWTGDLATSRVEAPFKSLADLRNRVLRIEAAAATGVLSAECTPSFPCPYFYLHEEIDRELITDETVDMLAREYEDARRREATAKGQKEHARRALRLGVENDKITTHSGVKVTFYTARNPPALDRPALVSELEKHGKKLDDFMTQTSSERVRVTLPKEDTDAGSSDEANP